MKKYIARFVIFFLMFPVIVKAQSKQDKGNNKIAQVDLVDFLHLIQKAIDETADAAKSLEVVLESVELEIETEAGVTKSADGKFIIKIGHKRAKTNTTTLTYTLKPDSSIALPVTEKSLIKIDPSAVVKEAINRLDAAKKYNCSIVGQHRYVVNEFSCSVSFKIEKSTEGGIEISLFDAVDLGGTLDKSTSFTNSLTFNYSLTGCK